MQVNGHTRDEGRSNPAMSQRPNTVPRHPVPANGGGIIRFMARIISFPATVLAILILIGMLL